MYTFVRIVLPCKLTEMLLSSLPAVETFADCLKILSLTKKHVGEILSAFEFLDLASRHLMLENLELPYPIAESPFYLLIETSGNVCYI